MSDKKDETPVRTDVVGEPGGPIAAPVVQPTPQLPPRHHLTPEEVGPGGPFDPTVAGYRTAPVAGPDVKKSSARVKVLYGGPSDEFHAEFDGVAYRTNRYEAVEMPESGLEWLRAQYPGHSWGTVKD